jgi:outer membrane protein
MDGIVIDQDNSTMPGCGAPVSRAVHIVRGLAAMTAIFLLCWNPIVSPAEEKKTKPLWEIGLAGGGAWVPDYPAADENHLVGLPLPYFVYRSRIFRAGDDGIVRGRFLRSERHEFDISISGSFPTDSDNNDARRGMPDLDYLFEVGPRLKLTLAKAGPQGKVGIELPVRTVFSMNIDEAGYRGVVFHPKLVYRHNDLFTTGVTLKVSAGPIFATEKLMDYFYEVAPRFTTSVRPAFDADAGYLGSEFTIFARKKLTDRISIFGAVKVGYYEGATNQGSPLFRRDVTVGIGFGFIWSIYQSKRLVVE